MVWRQPSSSIRARFVRRRIVLALRTVCSNEVTLMQNHATVPTENISPSAFSREATLAMGQAFDRAWHMIEMSRTAIADEYGSTPSRELLAGTIVAVATRGERDAERLCDTALATLLPARS
jgi:hypothetical protein